MKDWIQTQDVHSDFLVLYSYLRFGDGYTVRVWLNKDTDQYSNVSDFLKVHFPEIQFKVS